MPYVRGIWGAEVPELQWRGCCDPPGPAAMGHRADTRMNTQYIKFITISI